MHRISAVLLLMATIVSAQELQKWRTKEGRVVYGNAPPQGAEVIQEFEAVPTPAQPSEITPRSAEPSVVRAVPIGRWKHDQGCGRWIAIQNSRVFPYTKDWERVVGVLELRGDTPIKNLKVCSSNSLCNPVKDYMEPGQIAEWYVDRPISKIPTEIFFRCSVRAGR